MRRELAQNWSNLLMQAHTPPVVRDPHVPLNRDCIIDCEPEIQEVLNVLLTPLPVQALGVAMASRLLRDGTGPLFDRRHSVDLGRALREVIAKLDPSASLVPSA
jgi:hypothetical protein